MDTQKNTLLSLLAIRLQGGHLPDKHPDLRTFKTGLAEAREQGLVEDKQIIQQVPNATGKLVRKTTKVTALTHKGEQYLRELGSTEVQAAAVRAHFAALQKSLDEEKAKLREEVLAALAEKKKAKGSGGELDRVLKDLGGLIGKLSECLGRLEKAVQPAEESPAVAKLEAAFADFGKRVEGIALGELPPPLVVEEREMPAPMPLLPEPHGSGEPPAPVEKAGPVPSIDPGPLSEEEMPGDTPEAPTV